MKKYIIYIIVGVVALLAVYFLFIKKKTTTAGTATNLDGKAYSEADILRTISDIKGTPDWYAAVKKKAADAKRSEAEQLRLDAIWQLENA